MNVIPGWHLPPRRVGDGALVRLFTSGLVCLLPWTTLGGGSETHAHLQAVQADGTSAWGGTLPFTLQGVLLNDPEELLEATPRFVPWNDGAGAGQMGGEWQVFIQAVDPTDRGGTACWLGQNYGNLGWVRDSAKSYTDAEWAAEVNRLSRDPMNHHRFRKGDLVEVSVNRSLFYGGKRNINEAHDKHPEADFAMTLVRADHGLPKPELITLADLVRPDDGDPATKEDRFDPTRETGGERYQGVRVRINGVTLTDASGWGQILWSQRKCVVSDGVGHFLTLRPALGDLGAAPTGTFDALGVVNQESGSGTDGTFGYELFLQEIILHDPPTLQISVLSWPASAPGYRLFFTDDLSRGAWQPVTATPTREQGSFVVRERLTDSALRWYRLEGAE